MTDIEPDRTNGRDDFLTLRAWPTPQSKVPNEVGLSSSVLCDALNILGGFYMCFLQISCCFVMPFYLKLNDNDKTTGTASVASVKYWHFHPEIESFQRACTHSEKYDCYTTRHEKGQLGR